jgi:hypothetical protein
MESADHLGPQPPEVMIALGQETQDLAVVGRLDNPKASWAQGCDGNRKRIVGIILVRAPRAKHPHSGRQSRWNIEHEFTGIASPSCSARRYPSPPADSMAQVRFSNGAAHESNFDT